MRYQRALTSRRLYGAVSLVALGAVPVQAANLLINPSFEAPTAAGSTSNVCTGWTFINDMERSTFNMPPDGTWNIWGKTFQDVGGGIQQTVQNVSAGATYTLGAQMFFEENFNQSTATAQLSMTWLDSGGTPVGTPALLEIPASSDPATGVWELRSFNAVAPANTSQIRVFFGWVGGMLGVQAESCFWDLANLDGPGIPPTNSTWAINGSGEWLVNGNWANGIAPNGPDTAPEFFGAISSAQTVFTNEPVVAGSLKFNNTNTYVIAGAGQLTIDVTTGTGLLDVDSGSHKINLPLILNDNTTADVAGGASLTIADPLNLNGRTLTKVGAGNLSIISTVTGGAAPAAITGTNGTTQIDFGVGTPATASTAAVANVTVSASTSAGAKVALGANQTLRRIDAVTAAAGDQEIDLGGHIVRSYQAPLAIEELNVYNDIKNARLSASGRDGIYDSTSPGTGFAIGVTDQAPDAHGDPSVLLRLTRQGDANVDGSVTLTDFNRLAASFGQAGLWDNGDFNFDGMINLPDFNLLAGNFGLSASPGGPTPEDWSTLAAAVPEPTSLATILACASASLISRRRRTS